MNGNVRLHINDWCKRCGICAAFCPKAALKMQVGEKPLFLDVKCSGCRLCELRCPDFAIRLAVTAHE